MTDLWLDKMDQIRKYGYRPVVVGCLINKGKVLMVYKAKHKLWQLPQGGIESQETVKQALRREMKEELGQDFMAEEMIFLGADAVNFPARTQGRRELKTKAGLEIKMKGAKYFFMAVKRDFKELDIKQTEFDELRWVDYITAAKLAAEIYQPGKKRITLKALHLLNEKKFIK